MAEPPVNPPGHDHDHFTSLPSEVIQQIASYLYATHIPDKAHQPTKLGPDPIPKDLLSLSSTSKVLNQQTQSWAHHFLHQHRSITKYRDYKSPTALARQNPLRQLLHWTSKTCVFCGKKSSRSAILMNGLRCCRTCDREQWEAKITKTEAMKMYKLKEHQLLPPYPMLRNYPGLPKLRYGTYFSAGVLTTMFMREDVAAFAELAHSDFTGHLEKRTAARRRSKKDRAAEEAQKQVQAFEKAEAGRLRAKAGSQNVIIVIDDDEGESLSDDRDADDELFSDLVVID